MGIDSEIPPGQSSNDWGPLTLQCMGPASTNHSHHYAALLDQ
jgi:hypothetical protein